MSAIYVNQDSKLDYDMSIRRVRSVQYMIDTLDNSLTKSLIDLEDSIRKQFYPQALETPFPPRKAFLLNDRSSFLLVSSYGKICYLSEDFMREVDISSTAEHEINKGILINDHEIILGIAETQTIQIIDLKEAKIVHYQENCGFLRKFLSLGDTIYIPTAKKLYRYRTIDRSIVMIEIKFEVNTTALDVKRENDEDIFAIALITPKIVIFNLNTSTVLAEIPLENRTNSIKVSESYLIYLKADCIIIYSWGSWELNRTIKSKNSTYECFDMNSTETLLAAGCFDGTIQVWSLEHENLMPQIYIAASGGIQELHFKSEQSLYCFCNSDSKIFILDIPEFPENHRREVEGHSVKDIVYLEDQQALMMNLKDRGLVFYDAKNLELIKDATDEEDALIATNLDPENYQDKLFRISPLPERRASKTSVLNCKNLEPIHERSLTNGKIDGWRITVLSSVKRHPYIIKGYMDGQLAINNFDLKIIKDMNIHFCEPTAIASFHSGLGFISGDIKGNVIHYDLEYFMPKGTFKRHANAISAIEISIDDSVVVCASRDGIIRVSDIRSKACMSTVKDLTSVFNHLYLTSDLRFLMGTCEENYFCVWDFRTKSIIAKKNGVNNFIVFQDEKKLCLSSEDQILLINNPFYSSELYAFGDSDHNIQFFSHVLSVLNSKNREFKPEFENILITPFFMNLLHLYTCFNNAKAFRRSLEKDTYIVQDIKGHTPLSMCILSKSSLINDIIEYLIEKIKKNSDIAVLFEDHLSKINRIGSEHLERLYLVLFKELKLKQLPDFCSEQIKLPISILTESSYDLKVTEFFDKNSIVLETPIDFCQFLVKMNLESASSGSVELLESLVDCPNEEIFRTPFFSFLLDKKWKEIRWLMYTQGSVYYSYLLLLLVYLSYSNDSSTLLVLLILSTFIFGYEFWQIAAMKLDYFASITNHIDMARGVLFVIYSGFAFNDEESEFKTVLIVIITILSFLRGLIYFRLFDATRYLGFLIGEVMKDLVAFGIIMLYSIVSTAGVYASLNFQKFEDNDIFELILDSYTLSLGDFEIGNFNIFEKLVFVVSTIINTIIMLNLLISILGDTFDRVQEAHMQTDRKAVADMIIEVEKLYLWRRDIDRKSYFTVCKEEGKSAKEDNEWEGKIRTIMNNIKSTKELIRTENERTRKFYEQKYEEETEKIIRYYKNENQQTRDMLMKEIRDIKSFMNVPEE